MSDRPTAPTPAPSREDVDLWRDATWEGARMATLLEGAGMTMAEKLAWLEEAGRLARQLHGRRPRQPDGA